MGDPSILPLFSSTLRNIFAEDEHRNHLQLTRAHPQKGKIFHPDSTTLQLQEQLTERLASASGSNTDIIRGGVLKSIDLSKSSFSEELKEFFTVGEDEKLSNEDIRVGLIRMGESFISRNSETQQRANTFVIKLLGYAEQLHTGYIMNHELADAYEKAQLLLLLSPSNSNSSHEPITTARLSTFADDAADCKTNYDSYQNHHNHNQHSNFRPSSKGMPKDDGSEIYGYKHGGNNDDDYADDRPGSKAIVNRVAVPKLFRSRTTLAADMKTYVLSSSCFAMEAKTSSFLETFLMDVFKGRDSINMHDLGGDEFVKLHELWDYFDVHETGAVSRKDIRNGVTSLVLHFLSRDETTQNIANEYMQRKLRHAVEQLERLHDEDKSLLNDVMAHSLEDGSGKGSGLGLGLGFRGSRPPSASVLNNGTVLPPLSARAAAAAAATEIDDKRNPRSPALSSVGSSPMKSPIRTGSAKMRGSLSPSAFSSMNTEDFHNTANLELRDLALQGSDDEGTGPATDTISDTGAGASTATGTQAGAEDDVSFANIPGHNVEGQLPLIVALRNSLGPGFRLHPDRTPMPKFKQDYHLKFGASRQFWFQQCDYGVKFEPFFAHEFVANPELVTSCPSAMENFRCMFLHLGVGVEVHPFVLQAKFRVAAERLLSLPDDQLVKALFQEHLTSVVTPDSYVEMDVLHAVWPSELNGYRIMLVSFEEVGSKGFYGFKSIVSYTPETGPFDDNKRWRGKDVIMTLKDGHFTYLAPHYGDKRNSKPWSPYPIDDLVKAIEEYNTEFSSQPICLLQYPIGDYLHQDGSAAERPL